MRLSISDAGIGFNREQAQLKDRLGLISLEERIRLLNGVLRITSEPGRGTELLACVPFR